MCIIVAKPENVKMPSFETLKTCFENNPDGAGFMYSDGKTVRIRKGFMTFDEFVDAVNEEFAYDDATDYSIVMHFRIQTSGDVLPECTHPFPVTSDEDKMKQLRTESRWGIAHNGVIHGRNTKKGWSDTMDFVAGVVAPLSRINANFMRNGDCIDLLKSACGSKLCILENSGEIVTIGEFITENGVKYSNTSYLARTYNWSSYASLWDAPNYNKAYGYWDYGLDDDDDEYDGYDTAPTLTDDDIERFADQLEFDACQICEHRNVCALYGEECIGEEDAVDSCCFYSGYDKQNVIDLLELVAD